MPIHPVNSAFISFGRREKEQTKSKLIPGAVVGAAAGAGIAHFNNISLKPDNIGDSLKTIETKLPKSMEQNSTFNFIKDTYESLVSHKKSQMEKMGIEEVSGTIPSQKVLDVIVDNKEEKNLGRLQAEIEWIQGEVAAEKDSKVIAKKQAIINEKASIKKIVENATDEKVKVLDIENYYNSAIKNNPKIKQGMEEFSSLVKGFNKRRLGIFATGGLAAGAFVGNMFKTKVKPKEEIINV